MRLVGVALAGVLIGIAPAFAQYAPRPPAPIGPMPADDVAEIVQAMGLDPVSPVGPPPTPEALKARREAEAKAAEERFAVPPSGKATRVSSLAAGINSGDVPAPPNDPPEAANQPAHPASR